MTCVRQANNMNPTVGLALALNAETLYIRMNNLGQSVTAIRDYYYGKDATKYQNWDQIVTEFESIISELEELKEYLKENKENLTNALLEESRRTIVDVKDEIKELIISILEVL